MVRVAITSILGIMIFCLADFSGASAKNWNTGNNSQTASNQTKTLAMSKKMNESTSRFIRDKYSCIIGNDQSQRPKEADNRELQDINFAFAYLDNDNSLDLIQGYDKEPKDEFNITEPLEYMVFLSSKKKFTPAVKTLLARKILVQDFNGDGKDDVFFLAAGNHAPPRKGFHNTILLSVKDGHKYESVDGGSRISHGGGAGDLDKDGDIDVVVANGQQKTVQLLTNKGDGTFKATSLINEWQHGKKDHFYTAEVWDIDGDGFLDVVLGTPEVGLVFLWGLPSSKDSPKFSSKQRFSPPILKDRLPLDMAFADFDGDGHDEMAIIDTRIFDKRYRGWGITLVNFDGNRKPTIRSVYDDDPQQNFHWHGWIDACDVDGDGDIDLSAQMIGNNDLRKYPNVGKIEWINQDGNWTQKIINRDELLSQQKRSSTSMTNKGPNNNATTLTPQPSVETPDGTTPSKELCKAALLPSGYDWNSQKPLWVTEAKRCGLDVAMCNKFASKYGS